MYLPSLNELNKTAVQQKVIDQSDERIQRNAHQSKSVLGANKNTSDQNTSKFSINQLLNLDFIIQQLEYPMNLQQYLNHQEDSVLTPLTNKQNNSLTSAGGLSNNQASGQGGFQAQNQNQLQQGKLQKIRNDNINIWATRKNFYTFKPLKLEQLSFLISWINSLYNNILTSNLVLRNMSASIGPRRDRYGNVIRIGEKAHKLSFRDQVEKGEKISQIYEVESWKQYNTPTDIHFLYEIIKSILQL